MVAKKHLPVRTDKPLPERYVSMSNALARSAQGLRLPEKRALSLALAKTDSVPAKDLVMAGKAGWVVKLTAEEYAETFQVSAVESYVQLKAAAKNLIKRQVRTMTNTPRGLKEVETNWCGQCTYHHGEGWVEIAFTPQISPHLLALRTKFTSYQLKQASALRSIYAWRLFECLQSWKKKGVWSPTVEEFNRAMDVPPSLLKNFGQVTRRVIAPAVKELREKDSFIVDVELVKSGRKVISLVLKFKMADQMALF
jgi:plasmid replication initiation protein